MSSLSLAASYRAFNKFNSIPRPVFFLLTILFVLAGGKVEARAAAPTPTLIAPSSAYVNEVILVDARQSAGFTKVPQADGTSSVVIDFGDGATANLLASGHAYRAPGAYTITLTCKNGAGETATASKTVNVFAVPAASGSNLQVLSDAGDPATNGANLQQAVNRAAQHNSVEQEIVLPAGATFAGPIVLTAPNGPDAGDRYITIRTSAHSSLPPTGVRVTPAHGGSMAVITVPSSAGMGGAAMWTPYPAPEVPSHHYRIRGVHFKKDLEANPSRVLLVFGDIDPAQSRVSQIPHHFIVEHCWFDGGAGASELTNGVRVAADHVSIADSHLAEFRVSAGVDTAAISIVNSQGPYSFVNNLLVATSENVNFGGGRSAVQTSANVLAATLTSATLSTTDGLALDQNIAFQSAGQFTPLAATVVRSISGNQITFDPVSSLPDLNSTAKWGATPSYAELRGNHFYKPVEWWASHPSYAGRNWVVKNLFETKDSRYLLLDGNLLENHWQEEQSYAVALAPRNQEGNAPFSVVRDVQVTNNHFRNLAAGIGMLITDDRPGYPSQVLSDVTLRNNLFENVGYKWDRRGVGHWLLPVGDAGIRARRIVVVHNTVDLWADQAADHYGSLVEFGQGHYFDESFWAGNAMNRGWGGIHGYGEEGAAIISRYIGPGTTANWNRNMIAGANPALYPTGGFYPDSWAAQFVDHARGNFTLAASSAGKRAAANGSDVGVNMTALSAATSGAATGVWNSGTSATPTPTPTPLQSAALIAAAHASATAMAAAGSNSDPQFDSLAGTVEQAYTVFLSEQHLVASGEQVEKALRSAHLFARASKALSLSRRHPTGVQNRLQITASRLGQVLNMITASGGTQTLGSEQAHAPSTSAPPVIGQATTLSGATLAPFVAPASYATISGDEVLSPLAGAGDSAPQHRADVLPFELAGASVTINGVAAQLFHASPARVSFLVPAGLAEGEAEVIVTSQDGYVSRGTVTVVRIMPGLFTRNAGGAGDAVAYNAQSTAGADNSFDVHAPDNLGPDKRARVFLFATGIGSDQGLNLDQGNDVRGRDGEILPNFAESVVVEARTADARVFQLRVEFAGAGRTPGIDQITVILASELRGAGRVELTLVVGGRRSNTAAVNVR